MPDQIYTPGPDTAPLLYTIPGSQQMIPRAFQALFDGANASGDYIPAAVLRSQAGHVIARAILDSTITAGDDAEVSWFPGVKHAGKTPLLESRIGDFHGVSPVNLPSGAVTTLTFNQHGGQNEPFGPLAYSGTPHNITGVRNFRVYVDYIATFQAGNYDRYIEIVQPTAPDPWDLFNWRVRESVTPDGDILHIGMVVIGNPSAPATVTFNAFQSSGSDKTITAAVLAYGWPEIVGQGGWPG